MKLSCLTRRAAPANNRLYLLKPVLLMLQASSSGVVCVLVRAIKQDVTLRPGCKKTNMS